MRGRSLYRGSNDSTESAGGNSSELSAMLNAGIHHKQRRAPLLRTSSLKLPNKQLYTVSENSHEEPAIPSANISHHASKLMANRQRSSAASVLYTNLKNKRNSSNLSLKDMRNNSAASSGNSSNSNSTRQALNVVIQDPRSDIADQSLRANNPINHYQFARNMATRPKSSSTTHIPSLGTIRQNEAAGSNTFVNVELRPSKNHSSLSGMSSLLQRPNAVDFKSNVKNFPQAGKDSLSLADRSDAEYAGASLENEEMANTLLETQIETAMSEELFPKEYVFDNRFDDIIQAPGEPENEKARSMTSSNQSPLTRIPARKLSKTDSAALENFEHDLSSKSSAGSQETSNTSRLQMKMDIMKSRFDSFVTDQDTLHNSDSCTAFLKGDLSSHGSGYSFSLSVPSVSKSKIDLGRDRSDTGVAGDPRIQFPKFWFRNDLKTKLLTEQRSNQLKNIERFPSSGIAGEKVLTSRIKCLAQKGYLTAAERKKKDQQNLREQLIHEAPVLRMTDDSEGSGFERLFRSTRIALPTTAAKDDDVDPEKLHLRDQMNIGKTFFENIWHDAEQSELLLLIEPVSRDYEPKMTASIAKAVDRVSSSPVSDRTSNGSMPYPISPEIYRQASQ
ncbi:LAME_0G19042g1_1 [Lachancea meyersii CBS 8951]|uniref:LAME_0G19042g1_1 n=1 Tax=Lachancea meyersii CBS 8951 TaxID=1266667 RepID=A0A1G4KC06_9SACH|nr:LAME_0G19042g1_1 [Lachancea meyersii CBS 8951]